MIRTGIGYDVHRLVEGRKLVLGGVEIPHSLGLDGHSDADVLCHAIADAVLGAAGLPDIGHYFPPGDESIRGINSLEILRRAVAELNALGGTLNNVDATLIAERPKILPHVPLMKTRLAAALSLSPSQIGLKATTNETLGFLGRQEGMAALATACIEMPLPTASPSSVS
jgi:2-C-methyl-D-erythritol 2,4-cyclodiphosphate synthase